MKNPFIYSDDNKRYQTFNYYLRHHYGKKVYKVPLDAGFTCPNRDGKAGYGGCIYCSSQGSGEFTSPQIHDIVEQFEHNKQMMEAKWPNSLAIPYFQSYTNTYGSLNKIKAMIEPFIDYPEVCAIAIATRADCLEEDKISYLDSLCDKTDIYVELGLQSSNDKTAFYINRGHTFETFKECVLKLKKTRIKVVVHIINGLPYETEKDMLKTIKDIDALGIDAIKIHMLHVTRNTKLARIYEEHPFHLLTKDEYIDIVVKQLELLDKKVIIERLTGDPVKEDLIEPIWVLKKTIVLNDIDKQMAAINTWQGKAKEAHA